MRRQFIVPPFMVRAGSQPVPVTPSVVEKPVEVTPSPVEETPPVVSFIDITFQVESLPPEGEQVPSVEETEPPQTEVTPEAPAPATTGRKGKRK